MENQEKEKLVLEMKELIEKINKASYEYYVLDNPTISDKEWDKMYYRLLDIENETGIILENSPSQKVGGETLSKFKKITHERKLYSLAKAQSIEEIIDWNTRNQNIFNFDEEFTVEYKFDGLSLALTYDGGKLIQAATRGNGNIGEDVTEQVKTIRTVPLQIDYKGRIDIRGEGIIKLSELEKYNSQSDDKLKNARNAVAGAIRNLDPKVTASRKLDFFAYDIIYSPNKTFASQKESFDFLKEQGFLVGNFFKIVHSIDEIHEIINHVNKTRHELDFLIDGIVIKINKADIRERLGETEKTPRWAVAYKFEAEETSTVLNSVTWQVGRTGKVTPVAELEPTELCGVTIKRATLNNYNDILRKKVKLGDRVFIRRSNDVIPEILSAALALVYLIFLDASTIVVLACGVAVVCACVVARIKIEKKISFRTEKAKSAMSSTLANTISNLPIIYLYKSMMFESSIYRERTDNFLKEQKRQINLRWFYWLGVRIAQVTCVFVIIYLCAKQVYLGTMLVGNIIIVVNYVAQLFSPIQSVGYFAARWINCLVSVERLVELKPNENELLPLESENMPIETIELKNISAENGKFNLNNVNLKFKKDELVVVTGESGCGKSTLIKVICGLCEKNSGDIVINGSKKLDSGYTAVENMSVAMQSAYIFNRDVKLNVLYPDGTENENFKKVINQLSLTGVVGRKYDDAEEQTLENMLSGGEKKRIGLSRTLIKKADVYIFDEPTNDLDNSNAKKVIQSIEKLKKDAIVIVVSHDDRVKKIADRLIEFEERGKIKDEKNETSNRD